MNFSRILSAAITVSMLLAVSGCGLFRKAANDTPGTVNGNSEGIFSPRRTDKSIKVISYNIRLATGKDGSNHWDFRKAATPAMIYQENPDIFGLQEALKVQLDYLTETCPGYGYVGVPRDDGLSKGEVMAIFWNRNTQNLLDWGTFWLSETPEVPSKGWDAMCRRTATWALLKDKRSKKKYYYVNTHLDHRGRIAREKGLSLIADRIAEINQKGLPVILTGDFNVKPDNACLRALDGKMLSARKVAAQTDGRISFQGFGKSQDPCIIDYIYEAGFKGAAVFETLDKTYADIPYISDHYPIAAILLF